MATRSRKRSRSVSFLSFLFVVALLGVVAFFAFGGDIDADLEADADVVTPKVKIDPGQAPDIDISPGRAPNVDIEEAEAKADAQAGQEEPAATP